MIKIFIKPMNTKKKIYSTLVVALMIFSPMASFAQVDPCDDPDNPPCPIDGGLSLLIAAGIGLGAKKAYKRKKDKTVELKN